MWWRQGKENDKDKVARIIRETLSRPDLSIEHLAERLSNEVGIESQAAFSISKEVIDDFISKTYNSRIEIIERDFPEVFTLPYSQVNQDLINKEIDQFGKSVIDYDQFLNNTFEIRLLESEDWLTKGEKLVNKNELQEALNCLDISLKFNPYNLACFEERGKLLHEMEFPPLRVPRRGLCRTRRTHPNVLP